jgi:hypothetical protein
VSWVAEKYISALIGGTMAEKVVAHCMKCKDKREMVDPKETTTKNGRVMLKGTCPECGTTMCKFVSAK